jgi:hypothetical protein
MRSVGPILQPRCAAMAGSTRVLERLQIGERAFFVASHQTAVAGDIRRQPSFNAFANQKAAGSVIQPPLLNLIACAANF